MTDPDHSLAGSGAAGRATQGETDEELASEWVSPDATRPADATTPPDMHAPGEPGPELPDPDGSHHRL